MPLFQRQERGRIYFVFFLYDCKCVCMCVSASEEKALNMNFQGILDSPFNFLLPFFKPRRFFHKIKSRKKLSFAGLCYAIVWLEKKEIIPLRVSLRFFFSFTCPAFFLSVHGELMQSRDQIYVY